MLPLKNSTERLSDSDQQLCSSVSWQSVSSCNSHCDCSSKVVLAKLDKTHLTLFCGKLDIQRVPNDPDEVLDVHCIFRETYSILC